MTKATDLSYPFNSFIVLDGYSEVLTIPSQNRSEGMHVYAIDTGQIYVLQENLTSWEVSRLISDLDGYIHTSSARLVPAGGSDGYVLQKSSSSDFDVDWVSQSSLTAGNGVPSGGTTGQILVKSSAALFDAIWDDVPSNGLTIPQLDLILDGYITPATSDGYATRELDNLQDTAVNVNILPSANDTIDIGAEVSRWHTIYATNLYGNIDEGVIQ